MSSRALTMLSPCMSSLRLTFASATGWPHPDGIFSLVGGTGLLLESQTHPWKTYEDLPRQLQVTTRPLPLSAMLYDFSEEFG
jgi:hypothetical protein